MPGPLIYTTNTIDEQWERFGKGILRGEQTNEPRVTNVPVRLSVPRDIGVGSIYQRQTDLERPLFDATLKG